MRTAVYAGSFDPPTNGHLWIIREAAKTFDHILIVIAVNPDKKPAFSADVRKRMLTEITSDLPVSIVILEEEYIVNYASKHDATHLVRGVRNTIDYEYECALRQLNADLNASITSVYFIPPRELSEVSSSTVRGLVGPKGWERLVARYVPPPVLIRLIAAQHAWVWEAFTTAGAAGDSDLFWRDALLPYFESGRFHHAWTHIADGLNELARERANITKLAAVALAWFNHDRIYDVTRHDNEKRSAEACRESARALGLWETTVRDAVRMVLATKRHLSKDPDTRILIDTDLAVLGYEPRAFDVYEEGVRNEYRVKYTDKEISIGRAGWIIGFLRDHPERIYFTNGFELRYGTTARSNLERSLARLGAS